MKPSTSHLMIYQGLFVVVVMILAPIPIIIALHGTEVEEVSTDLAYLLTAVGGLAAVATAAILARGNFREALAIVRPQNGWRRALISVAKVMVVYIVAAWLIGVAFEYFAGEQESQAAVNDIRTREAIWLAIPMVVIFAPIVEEVIFRGVLLRAFAARYSFWVSAILTSVGFALLHDTWPARCVVLVISLIISWLYRESESILPGIIFHFLVNSLSVVLILLTQ